MTKDSNKQYINIKVDATLKQELQEYAKELDETLTHLLLTGAKFYGQWRLQSRNEVLKKTK